VDLSQVKVSAPELLRGNGLWKVKSASGLVVHTAGAYPGFGSGFQVGVFLLSLDGMLVHCRVTWY